MCLEKTLEKKEVNSVVKDQITNNKNSKHSLLIPNASEQNYNNMTKITVKNANNFHSKFWVLNEIKKS